MPRARLLRHVDGCQQRGCQRCAAAGRKQIECASRKLDTLRRRQEQFGALPAECQQRHPITVDIRLLKQGMNCAFRLTHAVQRHTAAGIHCEKEQRTSLAPILFDPQIIGAQQHPR